MSTTMNGTETEPGIIEVPGIDRRELVVRIVGLSPYSQHRWSEKARRLIEEKQQGKAQEKKAPKDPEEDREGTLYIVPGMEHEPPETPGRYYIPAAALKASFVEGVRTVDALSMTLARGLFYVPDDPILEWDRMEKWDAMVRNDGGSVDTRYRWKFHGWAADVKIQYDHGIIRPAVIANVINQAGDKVGIGEWRPLSKKAKNGEMGRYTVLGVTEL